MILAWGIQVHIRFFVLTSHFPDFVSLNSGFHLSNVIVRPITGSDRFTRFLTLPQFSTLGVAGHRWRELDALPR